MPNVIEISDISARELDAYARLTHAQLRNRAEPEKGIFIAESPKVIALALDAGCIPLSLLMEEKHIAGDAAEIISRCGNTPVYTASRDVLSQLTGYQLTRGVLCSMLRPKVLSPAAVCENAKRIAVLEGIVDSTNIGAIFRSAAALGMDGILLTKTCCDPLCRRSVRVSMGTVFQIPWAYLDAESENWQSYLNCLGFKTAAMALNDKAIPIDMLQVTQEEKLAIVMGTEGDGLSTNTIENCDYNIVIPMYHHVDSLNVAAASAVAFWELRVR
ncbi:MAG: RNA methyltransferase [Ruminococcaceae bacterium]|nr:RNA methyltransferase [Oscillospiraceae bacterium]